MKALLEVHDDVAQQQSLRKTEDNKTPEATNHNHMPDYILSPGDTIRMVGLRKKSGEPLGLTVSLVNLKHVCYPTLPIFPSIY